MTPNFHDLAEEIHEKLWTYIYNRKALEGAEYEAIKEKVTGLADEAETKEEFIAGFNKIWLDGPFSHIRLEPAQQSAEELANFLDQMKVGEGGAVLSWEDDIPILTVNTMMGTDTIEAVTQAYDKIIERNPKALIIDLRNNDGGAFAGMPLSGHIIQNSFDAGIFVSQKWTNQHEELPSLQKIKAAHPWKGWSLKTFWRDVQENEFTRIVFEPMEPVFNAPIYALVSHKTASAAEMTADALVTSGRAVLIGETTAGQMLSQKMYDLSHDLQLFLPIADYYSARIGRIEGKGVSPSVKVNSEEALNTALELIRNQES